jgi:hypothetical protein
MHHASRGHADGSSATVGLVCPRCRAAGQSTRSRTRLFRFLLFGLLRPYPLSWTFGQFLVPLLFRHRRRQPALRAEAIEALLLVSSLSSR